MSPCVLNNRYECMQVDNMNAKLFTECELSLDQRRAMADHWRKWERRRRTLSTLVDTAHGHLQQLPSHMNLPYSLSSPLAVLSAPPHSAQRAGEQPTDSHMHDVESEAHNKSKMQVVHASHVDVTPEKITPRSDTPRFLGNDPGAIERATAAMRALRAMHGQDRDMFVENLNSHMPGVLVNVTQVCIASMQFSVPTLYLF